MRYLVLTCLLFFMLPNFCLAQKWGLGIQAGNASSTPNQALQIFGTGTSSQNNFFFSYGISLYQSTKKQSVWRIRMNWEKISTEISSTRFFNDSNETSFSSLSNSTQKNVTIAPAIYWEMTFGKVKPRFGLEVPIRFFSPMKRTNNSISSNTSSQGGGMITNQQRSEGFSERKGGSSIGVGGVLGMSYQIIKGLSVAVEFIPTISYKDFETTFLTTTNQETSTKVFSGGVLVDEIKFSESTTISNTVAQKGFRFDQHQLQVLIAYQF